MIGDVVRSQSNAPVSKNRFPERIDNADNSLSIHQY